jgi:hypothetical protein
MQNQVPPGNSSSDSNSKFCSWQHLGNAGKSWFGALSVMCSSDKREVGQVPLNCNRSFRTGLEGGSAYTSPQEERHLSFEKKLDLGGRAGRTSGLNNYHLRSPLCPYPDWNLILKPFDLAYSSLIPPFRWPNLQLPCAHDLQEIDLSLGDFCDALSSPCHGCG